MTVTIKQLVMAAMLVLATSLQTFAQSDYDVIEDPEIKETIYKGQLQFEDLKKFSWFEVKSKYYAPDSMELDYLKKHLKDYDMVVVMGTWCSDSKELVPKLYATLKKADYPLGKVKIYGVDMGKEAKYVEHKVYNISRVPTIILQSKGNEIGRITETVKKDIETDLATIIQKYLKEL